MARNAAGIYSLPDAPVVAGTTITSADENTTRNDIAAEITNSLDRNGRGAMLAPLLILDGVVGQPGIAFGADTNTGIYRSGTDTMVLVAGGGAVITITTAGVAVTGTLSSGQITANLTGNVTGNASTVTTNANLTGPVTSVGNATTIASGNTYVNPTLSGTVSGTPTWRGTQSLNTSGNAATVTTNANLTGPITSVGNATTIASGNTYTNPTLSGTVSGTPSWASTQSLNTSGNAGTATTLQTARNINGVSFNGSADITITAVAAAGTLTGATLAAGVTASSLISAGTSFVWGTGVANFGTITRRKTADESVTSSTTFQDDDHLTFPIGANEEWVATYEIDAGAFLSTCGVKTAITVPSGATMNATGSVVGSSSASNTVGQTGRGTTSGGNVLLASVGAGNTDAIVRMSVWVLNGATPGNVTLQWAQTNSSATSLTFRKGSYMQATRVA